MASFFTNCYCKYIFFANDNCCYCMHMCIYVFSLPVIITVITCIYVYSLLMRFTVITMYYCYMYVYYLLMKTTVIVCICPIYATVILISKEYTCKDISPKYHLFSPYNTIRVYSFMAYLWHWSPIGELFPEEDHNILMSHVRFTKCFQTHFPMGHHNSFLESEIWLLTTEDRENTSMTS